MSNLFTVTIPDSAAALLVTYGDDALIRVQSSPTQAGAYGDVTTIPLVAGVATYSAYDALGTATDWYRIRYEAEDGDPAGSYSVPFQPMPLSGLYASLNDFNLFVRDSGTDPADDVIKLLAIEAASRAIDRATNRKFELATGTPTARIYTPVVYGTRNILPIDDILDDTAPTVMFDATGNGVYTTATTTFRYGPSGATARGRPYTEIIFDHGTVPPAWVGSVEVTANWGWPTVPNTITNACLLQASRFYKRRDAPFGIAGSLETGSELRLFNKIDPDVEVMVASYRKWWGAI